MNRNIMLILVAALLLVAVLASVFAYPRVPDKMASHWGGGGQPDGWMNKGPLLAVTPAAMIALTLLFFAILLIDPLRKNIDKFFSYYAGFIVIFNLFLLAVHAYMILWNLNVQINANVFFPIAMACLFFYLGIILTHVKPNWFIGIRTPWTLSSEIVWQKTHKLGGTLFKIAAIIMLIGAVFDKYAVLLAIIPTFAAAAITIIYSLVVWKKIKTDESV